MKSPILAAIFALSFVQSAPTFADPVVVEDSCMSNEWVMSVDFKKGIKSAALYEVILSLNTLGFRMLERPPLGISAFGDVQTQSINFAFDRLYWDTAEDRRHAKKTIFDLIRKTGAISAVCVNADGSVR